MPSGIADTVRAITDKNISLFGKPFDFKINIIIKEIITINKLICFENFSILIVSGDFSSFKLFTSFAICPISVLEAIAVTTPNALPVKTEVEAYTILLLLYIGQILFKVVLFFKTATLSPVRDDSSIVKFLDSIILASAGILEPGSKTIISPTTKLDESTINSLESLITFASTFINC